MTVTIKKEGISKEERIKKREEFIRIFRKGKKIETEGLKIYFNENESYVSRFNIVIGKKLGNAIKRNKIKRIIKEIYRKNKDLFGNGIDWIFIPYGNWKETDYYYTERIILDVIKEIKKKKRMLKICGSQKRRE